MKTKTKVLIAVGATASVALAQFGGVVFDPTVNASVLNSIRQAVQEYQLLSQMYSNMNTIMLQAENAARFATTKNEWIPGSVPVYSVPMTPNTYGTSAGWIQAINTGSNAMGGYQAATVPLQPYSATAWSSMSASQQSTVSRQYATVELSDAVNTNALSVAGAYQAQQASTNAALAQLTAKANSQNPADNTAAALANQQVAAALVQARESQATNQMLATIVEQNAILMKQQRDSAALGIAADAAERTQPSQSIGAVQAGQMRWQ